MTRISHVGQKTNTSVTTHGEYTNKTEVRNHNNSCNAIDCIFKPISRCTVCSEYYCYAHANEHAHAIDNFEILK